MGSIETIKMHIVFFPLMAHGHMPPMLDMAKLFNSRGLKTTIIATSAFVDPIKEAQESGHNIGLTMVKFPPHGSSLPDHIVSLDQAVNSPALTTMFTEALALLQEPVEKLLQELSPNCLVSDMFLPWTADSALELGIPRLTFHGTSYFALYAAEQMRRQQPYKNVSSDSEPFTLDHLPHQVKFVRTELSPFELLEDIDDPHFRDFKRVMGRIREAEDKSYGTVINSFYELEPAYVDCYQNVLCRKSWDIGPLLLCSNNGDHADHQERERSNKCLLTWLDSKSPSSVVYVCFGSLWEFTATQLREMATGLESSGQDFIWVVRKSPNEEEWLPNGLEERLNGKGLVIRGWAPQKMILDHPSTGAFVSHCGWNSILESICSGVPIAAWPLAAEQFFNAKLVTDVLKLGVSVGGTKWQNPPCECVAGEEVAKAVERVMVGCEAAEIRTRAEGFKEVARRAVGEGGSSYNSLKDLIHELSVCEPMKKLDLK